MREKYITSDRSGTLWVCATPIGNLGDISDRLRQTLTEVHTIAAEDTRITQKLLTHLNIQKPLISLQKYNEDKRIESILTLLKEGKDVALVSDAGTPNIADPGALLIAQLRHEGVKISPIPGPSAVTTFLSIAGILATTFYFVGFFPKKERERERIIEQTPEGVPLIFLESGQRILDALAAIQAQQEIHSIAVGKELTKWFETCWSGSWETVWPALQGVSLRGEWIAAVVLKPKAAQDSVKIVADLKALGLTPRQILSIATDYLHYPKNAVYHAIHHD